MLNCAYFQAPKNSGKISSFAVLQSKFQLIFIKNNKHPSNTEGCLFYYKILNLNQLNILKIHHLSFIIIQAKSAK